MLAPRCGPVHHLRAGVHEKPRDRRAERGHVPVAAQGQEHLLHDGCQNFMEYKKLGTQMPIAVSLGGDPIFPYMATAPLPPNTDECLLGGFLRGAPVDLVKCRTIDLEVPASAEIIIEGYIDTTEPWQTEGPFGDHTGFYSLADEFPLYHVTAITHRANPIYPTTIVG